MPSGIEEALGHDCFLCLVSQPPLLPTTRNLGTLSRQLFWTIKQRITHALIWVQNMHHEKKQMYYGNFFYFRSQKCTYIELDSKRSKSAHERVLRNLHFVFLPIIKSVPQKGQNTPKSDFRGPKIPPKVRVRHETCSTICGTPVKAILDQKNLTGLAGGSGKVQILPNMGLVFGF